MRLWRGRLATRPVESVSNGVSKLQPTAMQVLSAPVLALPVTSDLRRLGRRSHTFHNNHWLLRLRRRHLRHFTSSWHGSGPPC